MAAPHYPIIRQRNLRDCGIACLSMVASYYDRRVDAAHLRDLTGIDRTGTSFTDLIRAASHYGLTAEGVAVPDVGELPRLAETGPLILWMEKNHFVVYYGYRGGKHVIGDPAQGMIRVRDAKLRERFLLQEHPDFPQAVGYALTTERVEDFEPAAADLTADEVKDQRWAVVSDSLRPVRAFFPVILLGIAAVAMIQYLSPYFTKLVVDVGIGAGDLNFIFYLLAGQFVLILSKTGFNILRGWLVLHLSLRINFRLIAGFLKKLFALPVPFFETRRIGDILQRISDHHRIESFITGNALSVFISVLTVVVYSVVLASFHALFFGIFCVATTVYAVWIVYFLRARRDIDQERFRYASKDQSLLLQIINGMHDLKVNNSEELFQEKWRKNKLASFNNTAKHLKVNQIQDTGTSLIIEIAQLSILFLSATLIINNEITLGTMLSIQFIIGQLVAPMSSIVSGIIRGQEALISLNRITEFWEARDEVDMGANHRAAPGRPEITLSGVRFKHPGQSEGYTLDGVDLKLPAGKVTAIVGASGSGKTTILKLLLGYYYRYRGSVMVGGRELRDLDLKDWRARCGVILQESYVFDETIRGNIILGHAYDEARFRQACTVANLDEFAARLPQGYATPIGRDGKGLSMGQKQRILMARAVYCNPDFVIMDEATNSLDAENERLIMQQMRHFVRDRTVLIVAHRLSTIQFADNIVVLHRGRVAEQGSHAELLARKGRYYQLVKQQM